MTFSPLTARTLPTTKYNRIGNKRNQRLIIHYTAGGSDSSNEVLLSRGARDVSSNYVLRRDGSLTGIVSEDFRAWTSNAPGVDADSNSVTVETVAPPTSGEITDAQLNTLINLAVDLCRRYGWGRLTRTNVIGHREVVPTSCPGEYIWARMDYIVSEGNKRLGVKVPNTGGKTTAQLAKEVLRGDWGNGADRRNRLTAAGYNYAVVQAEVDRQLSLPKSKPSKDVATLAAEVRRGDWGNGADRKSRLTAAGYDYNAVQAEVNRQLGIQAKPAGKSVSQLATEVMRGDWGNGVDRQNRLTRAGYNYQAVQNEVNRRLYG